MRRTATHCNTLQHSATLCSTLQHSATHFHCNSMLIYFGNSKQNSALHLHKCASYITPRTTRTHRNTPRIQRIIYQIAGSSMLLHHTLLSESTHMQCAIMRALSAATKLPVVGRHAWIAQGMQVLVGAHVCACVKESIQVCIIYMYICFYI